MKLGRKFTKIAVFTVLFMLMSMAFVLTVAAARRPTEPTHSIDIVPRDVYVSEDRDFVVDVVIRRLPYADTIGPHGVGWLYIIADVIFDHTRFELVPYRHDPRYGPQYSNSDFSTWLDVNGNPVPRPFIEMGGNIGRIRVIPRISGDFGHRCTPVMSEEVIVSLRFRVRNGAQIGSDIAFSWESSPTISYGGVRCPTRLTLADVHPTLLDGFENRGIVQVNRPATPTQPTHRVNLVSQTPSVSPSGYVDLDIRLIRLPYADTVGRHYGFGWTDFSLDIHFDHTRFELVSHSLNPDDRVRSDFSTWLSVTGWPIHSPMILSWFPIGTNGTFRIWAMDGTSDRPVMSDVVLHLRFRVRENAAPGDNIVFSWDHALQNAGFCPITTPRNISRFRINNPLPTDFITVNVS